MIRIAECSDVPLLASMLMDMYLELAPDDAVWDIDVYTEEVNRCMLDKKIGVYIDEDNRGFFMVVDETETMTPELKRYNGTRVYIRETHRSGRVLQEFYNALFEMYPEGDILGLTVLNSKHIDVLEKRHTRIANLYVLNRS